MTVQRRITLAGLGVLVGAPLLVASIAWTANRIEKSKLDTTRFVVDSVNRASHDDMRDSLLRRIDSRVSEMYCGKLTPSEQHGCR